MRWTTIGTTIGIALLTIVLTASVSKTHHDQTPYIKATGTDFTLEGKRFYVTGVNNHYLTTGTDAEVIGVLDDAVKLGANVIRTYMQPVIGSLDGRMPTIWDWQSTVESSSLGVNGNYLLSWDFDNKKMVINEGPNGIQRFDFLVTEAKKRNLKLIVAFLDFHAFSGGSQQIRAWYGSVDKNEKFTVFFSDPRAKADYKRWVAYVLARINPQTGTRYRDEPTIMAWELMNEGAASPDTLRHEWTVEMSQLVKTLDSHHLVSSGHANAKYKVFDITLDLAIPTIDFATWHAYPRFFNVTPTFIDGLIPKYCKLAEVFEKPVLLEEFGYARSFPEQPVIYKKWLDTVASNRDCAGWLVWRLVSRQAYGNFPLDDYDQFDVRNDGTTLWNVIKIAIEQARIARSEIR